MSRGSAMRPDYQSCSVDMKPGSDSMNRDMYSSSILINGQCNYVLLFLTSMPINDGSPFAGISLHDGMCLSVILCDFGYIFRSFVCSLEGSFCRR